MCDLATAPFNKQFRTGRTAPNGDPVTTDKHEWWRIDHLPCGVKMRDTRR